MVTTGLLIRLHAEHGKEADVEQFLTDIMPMVEAEPDTTVLFSVQFGPGEYGIINAFPDETGLQAHIAGRASAALNERATQFLAAPPSIEPIQILRAKVPGGAVLVS